MRLNRIILVFSLLNPFVLLSQEIGITEVKVVEEFNPSIPEANRLNEKADFEDTLIRDRSQEYKIISINLESDFQTKPLKAAKVKSDKINRLYSTKLSLGTGFRVGSKMGASYISTRSKDLLYGITFNHINSNVKVDGKLAGRSKNNLHIFFKKINKDRVYIANFDYSRIGVFTYGNGTDSKGFDSDMTRNNPFYNRFAFTRFYFSRINTAQYSRRTVRKTTFFISDLNEMSESQIHFSMLLKKEFNDMPFNFNIKFNNYLNYNNANEGLEALNVKSLHFSPFTSFNRYDLGFELRLALRYFSDEGSFRASPQIKVTKELVKDVLLIYGGLQHYDHRHTIKTLSDENPYIHSYGTNQSIISGNNISQTFKTTDVDELYFGIRNLLAKGEVLKTTLAYGYVKNLSHFINIDTLSYSRFEVDYMQSVSQLHVNLNYIKQINTIISVHAIADYFSWNKIIFNKPEIVVELGSELNLRNKIRVKPSVKYIGKRIHQNQSISEILYVNTAFQYDYSSQLSAFLILNNFTNNSRKEIWSGYKEIGFNGIFGLNYSF